MCKYIVYSRTKLSNFQYVFTFSKWSLYLSSIFSFCYTSLLTISFLIEIVQTGSPIYNNLGNEKSETTLKRGI